MSLTITATEYQARVLNSQGQAVTSLRQLLEQRFLAQGIAFLDPLQERRLWLKAVGELNFINKEALATECAEAYHIMLLYGIAPQELYGFDAEGVNLFRKILQRFLKSKDQPIFLEALQNFLLQQPIELFGFADVPPLYQSVLQQSSFFAFAKEGESKFQKVYQAPNPETEFLGALAEIDTLWQAHPHKTFALVIQQNVLAWPKIYRLLKTHPVAIPYACSKSAVWADQPKFLFLKQLLASITSTDLLEISHVLISPFWPDDLERRAKLDVWMRDHLLRTISLQEVLQNLLAEDPDLQETQWFQAWSKLASFKVDDVAEFSDAFFAAAAMSSVIPAQAGIQLPHLHIVSSLEAVHLPVDAVWLLSADRDHYPLQKGSPALLPKSLLLKKGVPISAEALQAYGERVFRAITAGKEVYASFVPQVKGEEKRLSEFLGHTIDESRGVLSRFSPTVLVNMRAAGVPQTAPPLGLSSAHVMRDTTVISGGSQLLKEQAECPFKAFAHYRLQVNALGSGRELLDPLQKGLLVHAALEKIWDELKSQQALLALSDEERRALVARKVDAVLFARKSSLLRKLERERLIRILTDWLNLEAMRAPFEVEACELNAMVSIGGLQLRLRLDRVDRVGESRLIIDYKTGEVSSKGWFEERLREPQLPLYAVTNAAHGAIFASLKVGKMAYAGVVKDSECAFDQVKMLENWERQVARWQEQLEALALEFATNYAEVKPADDKVCTYCDLSSFCRIKEQA